MSLLISFVACPSGMYPNLSMFLNGLSSRRILRSLSTPTVSLKSFKYANLPNHILLAFYYFLFETSYLNPSCVTYEMLYLLQSASSFPLKGKSEFLEGVKNRMSGRTNEGNWQKIKTWNNSENAYLTNSTIFSLTCSMSRSSSNEISVETPFGIMQKKMFSLSPKSEVVLLDGLLVWSLTRFLIIACTVPWRVLSPPF